MNVFRIIRVLMFDNSAACAEFLCWKLRFLAARQFSDRQSTVRGCKMSTTAWVIVLLPRFGWLCSISGRSFERMWFPTATLLCTMDYIYTRRDGTMFPRMLQHHYKNKTTSRRYEHTCWGAIYSSDVTGSMKLKMFNYANSMGERCQILEWKKICKYKPST